jgi:NAD(P)-dependent dehydrogenase (short-subunit alcohol dehydrogenase family)
MTTPNANKTVLVTGANSGLGFESALQLAELGYGKVVLACRTIGKAEAAKQQLAERAGRDPFETIEVDVSSVASANAASEILIQRGYRFDALLLNAGMVSGSEMKKSDDDLEMTFAASIVGHHVLTVRLLSAEAINSGARIVIAGSEAARGDLPGMMGMNLYDFATGTPHEFGDDLHTAMTSFARGAGSVSFDPYRHYAVTKAFTSWWTGALSRKLGDDISVFTVSPGSSMGTAAARHTQGFKKFLFTKVMPFLGPMMGMDQPVPVAAKRYIDVLEGDGEYVSGSTYTSKEKKMVGPLFEMKYPHLVDTGRQDLAFTTVSELTNTVGALH